MIKDTKSKRYQKLVRGNGFRGTISSGIHSEEGGAQHEAGMSIAELGSIHEFGLGVPERSFIRAWFDENKDDLNDAIKAELEFALASGNLETVLPQLAVSIQASIQERISNGIDPENAESTIRRKGSSTPLVDTGVLRSAILTRHERG